jgi:peptidoglycan hydrolase CwlO-like protein
MRTKSDQLEVLVMSADNKMDNLNKLKAERDKGIEELNRELISLRDKRKQLEYELTVA